MNESKLQHMAYKHCVQNQSKKLVFLSHFVFRQHLMDHNFHNVYKRKDDALENGELVLVTGMVLPIG